MTEAQTSLFGETLKEARERFEGALHRDGQARCDCCGKWAKRYKRKLNASMAATLILLHRFTVERHPHEGWVHVERDILKGSAIHSHDFSMLRHWDLIEARPREKGDRGRTSGLWRITELGKTFARGHCRLPLYVHLYQDQKQGASDPVVWIHDALGRHFDYHELMGGA